MLPAERTKASLKEIGKGQTAKEAAKAAGVEAEAQIIMPEEKSLEPPKYALVRDANPQYMHCVPLQRLSCPFAWFTPADSSARLHPCLSQWQCHYPHPQSIARCRKTQSHLC